MTVAYQWSSDAQPERGTFAGLAHAMRSGAPRLVVDELATLATRGTFADAELFAPPAPSGYTRRLIWRDPWDGFAIVGMTWLPNQGTMVHDHAGRFGAEIIVRGTMRETNYDVAQRGAHNRVRLAAHDSAEGTVGHTSIIVPTLDIHALVNCGTTVAHTVHVYSTTADVCTTYTQADGWWEPMRRIMSAVD